MRLSTLLPLALAAGPSVVSAAGMLGFSLGDKNADGSCKSQSDYQADFTAISASSTAKVVRQYAASDCNSTQAILPAAKAAGFSVILGIWPDTQTSYQADLAAIQQWAPAYKDQVYAVTVGSETLYRGNFTGPQLVTIMQATRAALNNMFRIDTADSWNKYADGTADAVIQSNPDILLVNAFGFWQGQPIGNATHTYFDDIMQAFTHIETLSGGNKIEVWTGETGWPTASTVTYEGAQGGTQNAQTFWDQGVCGMLAWGFNLFFFEAFDELWKPPSIGINGVAADETHWGAMNSDRSTKFPLTC